MAQSSVLSGIDNALNATHLEQLAFFRQADEKHQPILKGSFRTYDSYCHLLPSHVMRTNHKQLLNGIIL